MVEDYHTSRARELGMPEGTGKRYSVEDLRAFYKAAGAQLREATVKAQTEDKIRAYLKSQADYNIYRGAFNPDTLSQLWAEVVEHEAVTTPERLFYLAVDILRVRLGPNWFRHLYTNVNQEDLTATERFQRGDKKDLSATTYSLHFYQPAFVSASDFLSIRAEGEALPDEHIEIIRKPTSQKWSEEKGDFSNQRFVFHLGMPITTHYRSRLYDEVPDQYNFRDFGEQLYTLHPLKVTPQQIQIFGRRLWQAHLNTPVAARAKSA